MIKPQIHIPYDGLETYLPFIKEGCLNLELYFGSRSFDDLKEEDIIRLNKTLDYGPTLTIHAPFMDLSPGALDSKVREVTIKRFSNVLDFAEILKPVVIVFHSGYEKWRYDKRVDIWLEQSLKTWKPLNKRAEDLGVRLAIENIFEDEPENLRLLMGEMDSKNFGVCFDTGHFNLFSKQVSLQDWLKALKQYIIELHLHDNAGDSDSHLAIGDGNFDFNTLFKELKDKDCVYCIEAHSKEDVEKSLNRLEEYFK